MRSKNKIVILISLLILVCLGISLFYLTSHHDHESSKHISLNKTIKNINRNTGKAKSNSVVKHVKKVNIKKLSVVLIGDSVSLGAKPALEKTFPKMIVNSKEGRQFAEAASLINQLKSQNQLPKVVIIALGTNGPFTQASGQDLINNIGKGHQIYWVNAYGTHLAWQDQVNQTIQKLVLKNNNVRLIDWAGYVKTRTNLLYDDGIHLKADGQAAYANLIKHALELR